MGSLLAAALSRAQEFLLEPVERPAEASLGARGEAELGRSLASLEVVVLGLTAHSGTSTVARGLATTLSVPGGRAGRLLAVTGPSMESKARPSLAQSKFVAQAVEVPSGLDDPEEVARFGETSVPAQPLPWATVWDVAASECERAGSVAARAEAVVLVAPRRSDPALGAVVAHLLSERFGRVLLVANRGGGGAWAGREAVCLPQSRVGALMVARGRRPAGAFGAALDRLATLAEGGPAG